MYFDQNWIYHAYFSFFSSSCNHTVFSRNGKTVHQNVGFYQRQLFLKSDICHCFSRQKQKGLYFLIYVIFNWAILFQHGLCVPCTYHSQQAPQTPTCMIRFAQKLSLLWVCRHRGQEWINSVNSVMKGLFGIIRTNKINALLMHHGKARGDVLLCRPAAWWSQGAPGGRSKLWLLHGQNLVSQLCKITGWTRLVINLFWITGPLWNISGNERVRGPWVEYCWPGWSMTPPAQDAVISHPFTQWESLHSVKAETYDFTGNMSWRFPRWD